MTTDRARAERRAALADFAKPARPSRGTRLAFVPSKSAQADLEPRHSLPPGAETGRGQLGRSAQRGLQGLPTSPSDEGFQ